MEKLLSVAEMTANWLGVSSCTFGRKASLESIIEDLLSVVILLYMGDEMEVIDDIVSKHRQGESHRRHGAAARSQELADR